MTYVAGSKPLQIFQGVHRNVSELGLNAQYNRQNEKNIKIKGSDMSHYILTYERLSLRNLYQVNIRTNNNLESLHNELRIKATNRSLWLYELL
ncbi:hypothetical protein T4D_5977 [Trichinella pseudospiralis]|uniref:Uncharacterized protein n=1 Tax=Trichinella pseudospiralis TaxID=6337 RepID=A0A0V1FYU4_TRIPS|nr:hypothetical protein T4D_5977 [Trichinella pseudospiralis]